MQTINLMNIRINGITFEDTQGELAIRNEEVDLRCDEFAPPLMAKTHSSHTMELIPDTTKDISLIVFGLLMAISQNNDQGAHKVTISGVSISKPWLTYKGEYFVTSWKVSSKAHRRVEHVMLEGVGGLTMIADPSKEPKLQTTISVEGARLLITSLNKMKGSLNDDKQNLATTMTRQLRSMVENDNKERGAGTYEPR